MSESTRKDIAVIIINYNSSEYTLQCVHSIFAQTSQIVSYQLIIVDNASTQSEIKKLQLLTDNPLVEIVYSNINLGFGGGNMLGADRASAQYLFFLNNDCILLDDCLSIMLRFCSKNYNTGLCGGQVYSESRKPVRSFTYMPTTALKFFGPAVLKIFNRQKYPDRNKQHTQPVKVELVSGSALFFNSEAFYEIGGFDLNLFFYCEEEDLGLRLAKASWEVYLIPEAKYIHFGGGSSTENFVMLREYYISLMYFFRKHYSPIEYLLLKIFYAFKFLKKSVRNRRYIPFIRFILKGAPMTESLRYSATKKIMK